MFLDETPLARVVRAVGGQVKAGEACGVSAAMVGKWIRQKHLPRTEYTKETEYADALSKACAERFTKEWILEEAHPLKVKVKKEST
ncbi:helix-turn-helix domain-containing protein [Acinetobacter sp. YH16040_T]|uniref:hypothetical protein n=1 Tax=unclassified Acinetobacter TaxID=196816 RepID=UPI0015D40BFF|nr:MULTISPECIES: hypothetical protein [unclassified Acinetobacter]UUS56281.1 helix-turn-helix domain-containing protein [Acinetobacter sp. YH16040_T]